MKYLFAPPSSVESERLFSAGENIYSITTNHLQAETGEMQMFLHYNLRVLDLEYEYSTSCKLFTYCLIERIFFVWFKH